MTDAMLTISHLSASIEGTPILKDFSLEVLPGQVHAIMGPNGAGKSTLAKVLSGHPDYEVMGGSVTLAGDDLLDMDPEERLWKGLFMSFQYPVEIAGVSNRDFLYAATCAVRKARGQEAYSHETFQTILDDKMQQMGMRLDFQERNVNEGFSGGEKKRNEILQMALLDPSVAILDETDSGLDIDAIRIVAKGVNDLRTPERSIILITHYQRLLEYIQPDFVHVMLGGRIVKTGPASLAHELEERGYDWLHAQKQ